MQPGGIDEPLMVGQVVAARYRVVRLLGRGAMGAVYEVEDDRLGNRLALKVLLTSVANSHEYVARFRGEARAAAAIAHPGVVRVFDFGTDDGLPFLVMEMLNGEDLHQRIQRDGAMDGALVVRIGSDLADAVAGAHEHKIIHRDLKPQNVFLAIQGRSRDVVKVLDFGIAKLAAEDQADSPLTRTGTPMGTPFYMSPEQLLSAKDVDDGADIYAIGAILYEALMGHPPFKAASFAELVLVVNSQTPRRIEELRPDVSVNLIAVIERALAKRRADRFASAREMADVLETIAESPSRPTTTPSLTSASPHVAMDATLSTGAAPASVAAVPPAGEPFRAKAHPPGTDSIPPLTDVPLKHPGLPERTRGMIPTPTAAQLRLIESIAAEWLATDGRWPRKVKLEDQLERRGEHLASVMREIEPALVMSEHVNAEVQRVWLTIAGMELVDGGKREVMPFLELLRTHVARFIAEPDGARPISSDDLTLLLGEERRSEFARLRDYYWKQSQAHGAGGTTEPSGRWTWSAAGLEDLRFEHVESGAQYIRLRSGSPVIRLGDAADLHENLLRMVYSAWHTSGEWPEVVNFCIAHRGLGDVYHTLFGARNFFSGRNMRTVRGQRLELSVDGVLLIAPDAAELPLLLALIYAIRLEYGQTYGEVAVPLNELARRVGAPIELVRRVLTWARNDLLLYLQVSENDGALEVAGKKAIRDLKDLDVMADAIIGLYCPDPDRCRQHLEAIWREDLKGREVGDSGHAGDREAASPAISATNTEPTPTSIGDYSRVETRVLRFIFEHSSLPGPLRTSEFATALPDLEPQVLDDAIEILRLHGVIDAASPIGMERYHFDFVSLQPPGWERHAKEILGVDVEVDKVAVLQCLAAHGRGRWIEAQQLADATTLPPLRLYMAVHALARRGLVKPPEGMVGPPHYLGPTAIALRGLRSLQGLR